MTHAMFRDERAVYAFMRNPWTSAYEDRPNRSCSIQPVLSVVAEGAEGSASEGRLMISPPSTWTDAHDLMEGASERRLIREACLFRDVGQRLARLYQEILGPFNPALHEPSVRGDAEAHVGPERWNVGCRYGL